MAKNFKSKNTRSNVKRSSKMILNGVGVSYPTADIKEEIIKDMIDTLATIPFSKISIPLNAKRSDILNDGDRRSITIGFIRNYNPETKTFSVFILDKYKEAVSKFNIPMIEVDFGVYNDTFTKINKISLINVYEESVNVSEDNISEE